MTTTAPREAFDAAEAAARLAAAAAGRRADRLGLLRLLLFFALVALAVLAFVELGIPYGIGVIVLGLVTFNVLVGRHRAAEAERDRQLRIAALNEGERASLDYDFSAFDDGAAYADYDHPYSGDLDVFGPNSVFALVNRTASLVGEKALADYARHCLTDAEHIRQRQAAIRELAPELGFRQNFSAAAPAGEQTPAQLDALRTWVGSPAQFQEPYWRVLFVLVPVVNLAWLASFFYLPFYLAILGYAPTAYLLYRNKARVDAIEAATTAAVDQLGQLSAMLSALAQRTWESDLLRASAAGLGLRQNRKRDASVTLPGERIAHLAADVRQLAIRANPYVVVLNVFTLWELRYARRIERWKAGQQGRDRATDASPAAGGSASAGRLPAALAYRLPTAAPTPPAAADTQLEAWLLAVGAFDALSSMAGVAFRYPHWRYADVAPLSRAPSSQPRTALDGDGLHHPLLPPPRSVPNDFSSPLRRHISLLTGSNMAGKSTLLRTVGLHLVMSQWGMPTPHEALRFSPVSVYTSMRTQDNLYEGASAFYAELQRLRVVVDATREGRAVFFLLDEILKGTNSLDRNAGGRALILQLLAYGGAGVVATHDLGLGELAEETDAVSTLRLEVETDAAGELYFDYTVKPGLAQSRNASALMRKLGLGVVK